VKQPFGQPSEPVISRSECTATLRLVEIMLQNLAARGDLPEAVLERVAEFESYTASFRLRCDDRDRDLKNGTLGLGDEVADLPKTFGGEDALRMEADSRLLSASG